MLILSRHTNETIIIGENGDISVTVVDVRGDKVRLGISAPTHVPVHRKEIYETIQVQQNSQPERNGPLADFVKRPE